jgi:predicted acylesterase/phospholipase RssA
MPDDISSRTSPAPADFAPLSPIQLSCDVVMKGGITSGIVYPTLVKALSGTFKFKNIGGTSAGAIAAVATAAAELGRMTGRVPTSFDKLADLPNQLGAAVVPNSPALGKSPTRLKSLFMPEASTSKAFALLTDLAQEGLCLYALWLAVKSVRLGLFLLALVLVGAWLITWHLSGDTHLLSWLVVGVLTMALGVIILLVLLARSTIQQIGGNDFGLCTGLGPKNNSTLALSPWMEQLFDGLAGIQFTEHPLTFGDLWRGASQTLFTEDPLEPFQPLNPAISLELMTSDLTLGLPVRMPFDLRRYFFRKENMERFFSKRVVQHLVDNPRTAPNDEKKVYDYFKTQGYCLLPAPQDLPVVVAARLSLSFPILLSAVPLYAADYSLPGDQAKPLPEQRLPERCWFSDGGITSNFPIHFFDQPLPEWPTFGINLAPFPPQKEVSQIQGENIYLPPSASRGGNLPTFTRLDSAQSLSGFFGLILNTMQNWRDNAQCLLPGYRDRIVTVFLAPDEGGLNLDMPKDLIDRLAARGTAAGNALVESFGHPGTNNRWNAHRWARFLSVSGMMSTATNQFSRGFSVTAPWGSYSDLLDGAASPPPGCYKISARQQGTARSFSSALVAAHLTDPDRALYAQAPKTRPVLRASPRV